MTGLSDRTIDYYKKVIKENPDSDPRVLMEGAKTFHGEGNQTQFLPTADELIFAGNRSMKLNSDLEAETQTDPSARTFTGTMGDGLVTAAKAVVGTGEVAVGLANIPTLGHAGKFMEENLGYKPKETHKILDDMYSPAQKLANEKVSQADGFVDTVKTAVDNPSTIAHAALESLPLMFAGGAIGKGLGLVAGASPWVAAAIGEGIVGAGSAAEQTRQQTESGTLSAKQTGMAVASGIGTGIFNVVGSRLAKKFGLDDIDTLIVGGKSAVNKEGAKKFATGALGVAKRIVAGGIAEGVFEELPQSVQEQIWSNAAIGQPLMQGVDEAAAMGMLTGAAMGGGTNALTMASHHLDKKAAEAEKKEADQKEQAKKATDPEKVLMDDEDLGKSAEDFLKDDLMNQDDDVQAASEFSDEELNDALSEQEMSTPGQKVDKQDDKQDALAPEVSEIKEETSPRKSDKPKEEKVVDKSEESLDKSDTDPLAPGSPVSFENKKGETVTGKIKSVNGKKAWVEGEDGSKYRMKTDKLQYPGFESETVDTPGPDKKTEAKTEPQERDASRKKWGEMSGEELAKKYMEYGSVDSAIETLKFDMGGHETNERFDKEKTAPAYQEAIDILTKQKGGDAQPKTEIKPEAKPGVLTENQEVIWETAKGETITGKVKSIGKKRVTIIGDDGKTYKPTVESFQEKVKHLKGKPAVSVDPNMEVSSEQQVVTRKVIKALTKELGIDSVKDLVKVGKLKIVNTEAELKAAMDLKTATLQTSENEGVQGAYDPATGISYIVAENVAPDKVWGVVRHELGVHAGLQGMLGKKHESVMGEVQNLVDKGDDALNLARQRVPKETHADDVLEETLAYFIEDEKNQGHTLYKMIVDSIRTWAVQMGIKRTLSTKDLSALVNVAIRKQVKGAKQAVKASGKRVKLSTAAKASSLSLGKRFDAKSGNTNFKIKKGRAVVGHISGQAKKTTKKGDVHKELGIDSQEFLDLWATQLDQDHRGSGDYQGFVRQVADQFPNGVVVKKFQASSMLQKALKKIPGIVETKNLIHVPAVAKKTQDSFSDTGSQDDPNIKYSIRKTPPPKKTIKAYKLFKVKKGHPGKLFPLFVGANDSVETGVWNDAEVGKMDAKGKVKSKLGPLAYRPGWHGGDMPVATHIGESGDGSSKPRFRPKDQVWAEIDVADDVDWQTEATKRALRGKKTGKIMARTAHIIDQIPKDGHYRYKTNSNMTGEWIITGSMKINRILSDAEISAINKKTGIQDLPRKDNAEFDAKEYGFEEKKTAPGMQGTVKVEQSKRVQPTPARSTPKGARESSPAEIKTQKSDNSKLKNFTNKRALEKHIGVDQAVETKRISKEEGEAIKAIINLFPQAWEKHFEPRFSDEQFSPTADQLVAHKVPKKDQGKAYVAGALISERIGELGKDTKHLGVMFKGSDFGTFLHEFGEFIHARALTGKVDGEADSSVVKRMWKVAKADLTGLKPIIQSKKNKAGRESFFIGALPKTGRAVALSRDFKAKKEASDDLRKNKNLYNKLIKQGKQTSKDGNEWFADSFVQWFEQELAPSKKESPYVDKSMTKLFRKVLQAARDTWKALRGAGRVDSGLSYLFKSMVFDGRDIKENYNYSSKEIGARYVTGAVAGKDQIKSQGFSANSKTYVSFDPGTICPKQRDLVDFVLADQFGRTREEQRDMPANDPSWALIADPKFWANNYDVAKRADVDVPCMYCYVEEARHLAMQKNLGGKPKSGVNFAMATQVFDTVEYVDYLVAKNKGKFKITDKQIAEWNKRGGLRMFSFSDYIRDLHKGSVTKMLAHAKERGLSVKAITKSPEFIEDFANYGFVINVSIDNEADGSMGGMAWHIAAKLKNQYENVKIRTVAFNTAHYNYFAKLKDHLGVPGFFVDIITPFHGKPPEGATWGGEPWENLDHKAGKGVILSKHIVEDPNGEDTQKRTCCQFNGKCYDESHLAQCAANCGAFAKALNVPEPNKSKALFSVAKKTVSIPAGKGVDAPGFKDWSKGYPVLQGPEISDAEPGKGQVFRVSHGTTNEFEIFDATVKGNKEGHYGAVNYFTSDDGDAHANYAGEGPDLTNRIEQRSEQLASEFYDAGFDELQDTYDLPDQFNEASDIEKIAEFLAKEELNGGNDMVIDAFVRLDNPVIIGGKKETWIEPFPSEGLEDYMDDAREEIAEENDLEEDELDDYEGDILDRARDNAGQENQIVEAIEAAILETGNDPAPILDDFRDYLYEEVTATKLDSWLRQSDNLMFMDDYEEGGLIGSHIVGQVFKNLGFDGIVMQNAEEKFPNMGIAPRTAHVHVFNETPGQIKDAEENSGAYNEKDARFKFSKKVTAEVKEGSSGVSRIKYRNDAGKVVGDARLLGTTIGDIEVRKAQRRKGYGLAMVQNLIEFGGRRAIPVNDESKLLFKKAGFKSIGMGYVEYSPAGTDKVEQKSETKFSKKDQGYSSDEFKGILPDAVAELMQESRGINHTTLLEKFRNYVAEMKREIDHFPELSRMEPGKQRSSAREILRKHQDIPEMVQDRTARHMSGLLEGLSKREYDMFAMELILGDEVRSIKDGLRTDANLPWGFKSTKEILIAHKGFRDLNEKNTKVSEALQKRRTFQRDLAKELVKHGIMKKEILKSGDYFHHQILLYWNDKADDQAKGMGTSSSEVRTKWRPWMAARKGSPLEYNTEYMEAEFTAISQQMAQIETAKNLAQLKKENDILPDLKQQAKAENQKAYDAWVKAEELKDPNFKDPMKAFGAKIAMGFAGLAKIVKDGTITYDGEFQDVVNAIRRAAGGPINSPRLFPFLSHLLEKKHVGFMPAAMIYKGIKGRDKVIKSTLGDQFKTWQAMVPVGHKEWKPDPNKGDFFVNSVVDSVLKDVMTGVKSLEEKDVRKVLARGNPPVWILPEGLADQLDNFRSYTAEGRLGKTSEWTISAWKQYILLNPFSALKYNMNNMSGDLDIVMAYRPEIAKPENLKKALVDLVNWSKYKKLDSDIKTELEEAQEFGVVGSGFAVQEVTDTLKIMTTNAFVKGLLTEEKIGPVDSYWKFVKDKSQIRENILRLAAFRWFKGQLESGARVYGASKTDDVNNLVASGKTSEAAAKMARELLGDYGNISKHGDYLRKRVIPFYSWIEINAPRYVYLMRNLKYEGETTNRLGFTFAKKSAVFAAKASMLAGAVMMFNSLVWPDELEELGPAKRRQMHLILGRRDDGSIITLRFQGAFSDALSWFAKEDLPEDIKDLVGGKSTIQEQLADIPKAILNKGVGGLRPDAKMLFETLTGDSLYPDALAPRPIRDKVENVLKTFKLDLFYRKAMGRPGRGKDVAEHLFNDILGLVTYTTEPGVQAYYDTRRVVFDWKDKHGLESGGGSPTKKGNALYYYRQALKYGDLKAAKKYLQKYYDLGGTKQGKATSIRMAHPLSGIRKKDRFKFKKEMRPAEKKRLEQAMDWYQKTYVKAKE
jgi:hypothetical protein